MIGTVKGDVHDIGKNLVDIILTNNGYEVHNIGIKAPLQTFVDKAKEVEADAIGMSGLLVKSTLIMRENLEELNDARARRDPGAARRRRARRAPTSSATCARSTRAGSSTARTRSRACARWTRSWTASAAARSTPSSAARSAAATSRRASSQRGGRAVEVPARSDVATDVPVFTPPFLGARVAKGIALDEIAGVHQRDRAVPQPVAVPARQDDAETDDEFKARIRPMLREELGEGPGRGHARARGRAGATSP